MSEDLSMWSYWRDKRCSVVDALEEDYPDTLASDPILQASVNHIKAMELAIEARMEQLEEAEDDDEL